MTDNQREFLAGFEGRDAMAVRTVNGHEMKACGLLVKVPVSRKWGRFRTLPPYVFAIKKNGVTVATIGDDTLFEIENARDGETPLVIRVIR